MKNLIIVALLVLIVWLSETVVRLENYHYASFLGFCSKFEGSPFANLKRDECLFKVETRNNGLWNLYYALKND